MDQDLGLSFDLPADAPASAQAEYYRQYQQQAMAQPAAAASMAPAGVAQQSVQGIPQQMPNGPMMPPSMAAGASGAGAVGADLSAGAAALACLVDDERQLGATVIDMGGGTTSIAVFFDGELIHTDVIPIGGIHVTTDIARGLSTPISHAERMKTLYGSVLPSPSDDREIIRVPVVGEDDDSEVSQVPRSMLVGIIRPRVEETFEMVRTRLEDAGFDKVAGRRLVLTGGASQLPGAVELAGQILDKQARPGRPRPMDGLAEAACSAPFATAVGLINYCAGGLAERSGRAYRPMEEPRGRIGRLGQWFRENF